MNAYIDTSAFLAVLDAADRVHPSARKTWEGLLAPDVRLYTNNYVLVETLALIQRKLGLSVIRVFEEDVLPVISVVWVDEAAHKAAMSALLAASRRELSLVDCASFETMRKLGLRTVFSFDRHFGEQGFELVQGNKRAP
jgi:predicted nucleic acid-binding protein